MDIKKIVREAVKSTLLGDVRNFNHIVNKNNKKLNESSINRMLHWLKNCDCAMISAFRNEFKDIANPDKTYYGPNGDWENGKQFTHEENRQKNKLMVAELLQLGYGVTKIKGVYPEMPTNKTDNVSDKENHEESYLVVNRNNDENFKDNLLRISEYYNQDSVYYKEAGAEEGHLIGTNGCGWPDYHENGQPSKLQVGTASNYMSRMGNHAFSFVGGDSEHVADKNAAAQSVKDTLNTGDEYRQRDWVDKEHTSFQARKDKRKAALKEAVNFWRGITNSRMMVIEDYHPLVRKTMCEAVRRSKKRI